MQDFFKDRFNILAISLTIIALIITSQLFEIQIVKGEIYEEQSQRKVLSNRKIPAPRGNIKDRYGVPLAVNRQGFVVQIIKTKTSNKDLNDVLLNLVKLLEKNNDTYINNLSKYITLNDSKIEFGSLIRQIDNKIPKIKQDLGIKYKDFDSLETCEEVFNYFRDKIFKVENSYSIEEAYKIMALKFEMVIGGCNEYTPVNLAKDIKRETVAELEERHSDFPGVTTEIQPIRSYVDAQIAAHVVGYVRNIDAETYLKKKDEGYQMTDIIGKEGIEYTAEAYLRGKPGIKSIEMDAWGRTTEEISENSAIPGNDVILTLDTRLQKVAMESLERNINEIRRNADYKTNFGDAIAGSAVAIDVKTGEVLALVSYPSYDPSIFLAGPDDKAAQQAITDLFSKNNEAKPAFNRAIQGAYAPGSTYKPITAIAALEEGVITPYSYRYDSGTWNLPGWKFTCLEYKLGYGPHYNLNLEKALATSCNIYFHQIGYDTGIDSIDKWAKLFGLGEKTGIEIPGERKGTRANKEYKKIRAEAINKQYPGANETAAWGPVDTAQTAIGQLYNEFTPLQLANYVAALANGGKLNKPYLIKKVEKYDGTTEIETKTESNSIPIKAETLNAVRKGMEAVIDSVEGTAAGAFQGFPYKVAGKTGTAETGSESKHSSNALFVCYAPVEDPQIAVAVVVERGAWGANTAPIARDILAEYFNLNNTSVIDDKIRPNGFELTR